MGSKTTEETTNSYIVGQKTVTVEDEVGRIRGMNVAILIDQQRTEVEERGPDGKPTGAKKTESKPYSEADLKRFEDLVLNAVGFNAARDVAATEEKTNVAARFTSSIQSMPFWTDAPAIAAGSAIALPTTPESLRQYLGWGLALIVAAAAFIVARGQLKRSHTAWSEAEARARAAADEERKRNAPPEPVLPPEKDEEDEMAKALKRRRNELRDSIKKRIVEDPVAASQIVRNWMYE